MLSQDETLLQNVHFGVVGKYLFEYFRGSSSTAFAKLVFQA